MIQTCDNGKLVNIAPLFNFLRVQVKLFLPLYPSLLTFEGTGEAFSFSVPFLSKFVGTAEGIIFTLHPIFAMSHVIHKIPHKIVGKGCLPSFAYARLCFRNLPYKYKSAALVDSAYGMNYIDTSASNGCPANILFSELTYPDDATYIRGHVNYTTKASYLCYNYTVIGLIE